MKEVAHIGELIKDELHRQGRSNVWLARQLSCNVRTVAKIFHKQTIDTQQLMQISMALDYDFFKHFSEALATRSAQIGQ